MSDFELYDISDVDISFKQSRSRKEITLIIKSQSDINLMRYYLSLRQYIERMEHEIGVMEAPPEVM